MNKKTILPLFLIIVFVACAPSAWWWLNWRFDNFTTPFIYKHITELQVLSCSVLVLLVYTHFRQNKVWSQVLVRLAGAAGLYCLLLSFYYHTQPNPNDSFPVSNADICIYAGIVGLIAWWLLQISKVLTPVEQLDAEPLEQLGRAYSYDGLVRYVREQASDAALDKRKTGGALSIVGAWGSGKSHCLDYIKIKLANKMEMQDVKPRGFQTLEMYGEHSIAIQSLMYEEKFLICEVCLWKCRSVEDAWLNIINELYHKIYGNASHRLSALPNRGVLSILRLASMCSIQEASILVAILEVVLSSTDGNVQINAEKIDSALGKRRALLILDDVERCDYEIICRLFPLIQQLRKITKLTIICSISEEELEQVYKREGCQADTLHGYLMKVFDYMHTLPPISDLMMKRKLLHDLQVFGHTCPFLTKFIKVTEWDFETPRQQERLLWHWVSMEHQYFSPYGEVMQEKEWEVTDTFENRIFLSFAVEAVRLFDGEIIEDWLKYSSPRDFFSENGLGKYMPELFEKKKSESNDTQNVIKNEVTRSAFINMLNLQNDFVDDDFEYVLKQEYAKRKNLTDYQCAAIVQSGVLSNDLDLENNIVEIIGPDVLEPCCEMDASLSLLEHIVSNLGRPKYDNALISAIKKLSGDTLYHICAAKQRKNNRKKFYFMMLRKYTYSNQPQKNLIFDALKLLASRMNINGLYYGLEYLEKILQPVVHMNEGITPYVISAPEEHIEKERAASQPIKTFFFEEFARKYVEMMRNGKDNPPTRAEAMALIEAYGNKSDVDKIGETIKEIIRKDGNRKELLIGSLKLLDFKFVPLNPRYEQCCICTQYQPIWYKCVFDLLENEVTTDENFASVCMPYFKRAINAMQSVPSDVSNGPEYNERYSKNRMDIIDRLQTIMRRVERGNTRF